MGSKLGVIDVEYNDDEEEGLFVQGLRVSLKMCSDIEGEEFLATVSAK